MTKEELKQEAEEYAEGMAKYYASTHEGFIPSQFEKYLRNACVSSAEPREKRIADLEKESAELKEINTHTLSQLNLDNGELITQLTKAKEIISEYINILKGDTKNWKKTQKKAEQFLKDSEVEK